MPYGGVDSKNADELRRRTTVLLDIVRTKEQLELEGRNEQKTTKISTMGRCKD